MIKIFIELINNFCLMEFLQLYWKKSYARSALSAAFHEMFSGRKIERRGKKSVGITC